jgi:hypothetical protein
VSQRVQRIALTGGPGAGKTAALEAARRHFCQHVGFVPETASILFRGGFPRRAHEAGRAAAQRAIYHVQLELEDVVSLDDSPEVLVCDRGTVDGLAYWPGAPDDFWRQLGTSREVELARYDTVIHLRTAPPSRYVLSDPLRVEDAALAQAIDARIEGAWAGHPHRHFVEARLDFIAKIRQTLQVIREHLPPSCLEHVAELGNGQR